MYKPDDRAASFEIEIPVGDGTVTARQLRIMIDCLVVYLERRYPMFKHAMEMGETNFDLVGPPAGS